MRRESHVRFCESGEVKLLSATRRLAKAMEPVGAMSPVNSMSPTITTPAMTQAGMILGTAAYMSPEQARGKPVDKRADVWAFGAVLFEMLTGARVFGGEDTIDTLANVRRAEPDWKALPSSTPAAVQRLLRRCLAKDRRARLADASSLRLEIDDAVADPTAVPSPAPPVVRRERLTWLAAVAVLAAVAALAMRAALQPTPAPAEVRFDIEVPSDSVGSALAVSPDGREVAFIAGATGAANVWVHSMDGRAARRVEGTEGAVGRVFWSPDGQSIGFFADRKLKRVDLATGAVQLLADSIGSMGASWSAEGFILFAPSQGAIRRISQTGGPATEITRLDAPSARHGSPQVLPNGQFLFFSAGDPATRGVYVGRLDGSAAPRRILDEPEASAVYVPSGHLLFPRQGALMVQRFDVERLALVGEPRQLVENIDLDITQGHTRVSVSDTGVVVYRRDNFDNEEGRLVWYARSGQELRPIEARDPIRRGGLALSPDARQAAVRGDGLHLLDIGRGVLSRFTSDQQDGYPLWSPDGSVLVYTTTRDGPRNLYQRSLSGGTPERLLASPGSKVAHDWSPDGRWLLYRDTDPTTRFDLWVVPVEPAGGQQGLLRVAANAHPTPVANTPAEEVNGQFSPDGQWIAFESDESGRHEVYIQPFGRGGAPLRVSIEGGRFPRWHPSGAELFFLDPNGTLMSASIGREKGGSALTPGSARALFPGRVARSTATSPYPYEVSADGREFLFNVVTNQRSMISAIVNWQP